MCTCQDRKIIGAAYSRGKLRGGGGGYKAKDRFFEICARPGVFPPSEGQQLYIWNVCKYAVQPDCNLLLQVKSLSPTSRQKTTIPGTSSCSGLGPQNTCKWQKSRLRGSFPAAILLQACLVQEQCNRPATRQGIAIVCRFTALKTYRQIWLSVELQCCFSPLLEIQIRQNPTVQLWH